MGSIRRTSSALTVLGLAFVAGCASTQKVSLECVPSEVSVYVDGRQLEDRPEELKLGVDEAHTVYFKGGGYQPQMVVLESEEVDGKRRLVGRISRRHNLHLLVYFETADTMRAAIEREKQIKRVSRRRRVRLIENMNPEWKDLYRFVSD